MTIVAIMVMVVIMIMIMMMITIRRWRHHIDSFDSDGGVDGNDGTDKDDDNAYGSGIHDN